MNTQISGFGFESRCIQLILEYKIAIELEIRIEFAWLEIW